MNFVHVYERYKSRINIKLSLILENLPFQQNILLQAMKYSTVSGSKRLRSCLVYVTGELFQVNIITLDVISATIECIHAYSLIHDDLPCMDNDSFRRDKISCHVKYGEDVALIAGDALQSLAFNILSDTFMPGVSSIKRIKMISELSSSIGSSGMCMGQILDLEKEIKKINLSELEQINLYKTAFLIRSCMRLVYLSSRYYSKTILLILDRFSISIGLAFQIQDDIFDLKHDQLQFQINKKNNKKIQKNTYPLIVGLDKSKKIMQELYQEAFFSLDLLKKKYFDINTLKKLTQFIIKRMK